ncbi:4Fe-4S ferredoxin, iron-sulfur binding domain protein [uncultured Pleomorphomonas sp.]|uniref:4Fe-4S ferredoxin, iron-sulfur binding domain protein n=1 Tax=uncultured Pleomorphomonas sp. TaxID=442121 RepID=A0A212L089_9HYPH|nr:pyridine nucleotide-disulfide oxidoreductase/dicluster-binding protein [uncultured Pleomorphomonas sp.]SCM70955.1 4Fe-4S ferredoxin, iron-sulfur binding domain protein [uncultured Pleomorphomonas sp.]
MDGDQVKAWEALCIEEQPPACSAACPLHVDARAMAEKMAAGDFTGAIALYARVVPFPAIVAHICEHPCEAACRRAEAGGAVRIGALERALVEEAYPTVRRSAQQARKPKAVAVVGAGLAGLTAAFDLVMKGHAVTVFEADAQPLDRLHRDYRPAVLPPSAIEADVGALIKLGVGIRCRQRIGGDASLSLDALIAGHDAVLMASGPGPASAFSATLRLNAAGRIEADRETRATSHPKVFASGLHDGSEEGWSAIGSAADGRRAAGSIDRFLQGASLTASRGGEATGSCLYVDVGSHAAMPPVEAADPAAGYGHAEAIAEAARCFPCHCLECVKACPYLAHYKTYPKRAVREIYNNDSIIMGNRKSNRMIDSCALCGLCETLCPNDLAMGEVCLDARRSMVERGHMPASHHDFALRDMAFSRSDEVAFIRHQPGHDRSAVLFFPGCQLPASAPRQVEAVYRHLSERLPGGVGFMLDCCGAPAHWSGRQALHREVLDHLRAVWEEQGRPRVVTACSTCLKQIGEFLPDIPVASLWTELVAVGLPDVVAPRPVAGPLAIHDPCTGRHAHAVQAAVRSIAASLGAEVRELTGAEKTTCCGYGGLASFANPEVGNAFVDRRIEESDDDYLAYCAMCRDNFARRGKRALHLIDLVFPDADDPAARPDPGFSGRRDNRQRLRRRLLRDLWGESMSDSVPVPLVMTDAVRADIERKLLLIDDIAEVIAEAERTGRALKDRASGHLTASGRIGTVTTWVEYQPTDAGFVVHRAYGHRMQVEVKP